MNRDETQKIRDLIFFLDHFRLLERLQCQLLRQTLHIVEEIKTDNDVDTVVDIVVDIVVDNDVDKWVDIGCSSILDYSLIQWGST